jgi:hypothetical protein
VAEIPDQLVLKRHRDLEGRRWHPFVRHTLLVLLAVLPVLGLINVFGQRPETSEASAPAASLKVYAADRVRGGLLYEARFHIAAKQALKEATLVLSSGWLEGMTVNTIEPSPIGEASRNGSLALELGHIPAGESYLLFIQFQVNPTNVGHRTQNVALDDGEKRLVSIHRAITVYP